MKRLKADFRRGEKSSYDFKSRTPPPAAAARTPMARGRRRAPHPGAGGGTWIGNGILRAVLLAVIVFGGVGAVVWIRDLGTAFGVQWLK